jgi:23S rRNA-/tRNA-specific pseudouridylate synthase
MKQGLRVGLMWEGTAVNRLDRLTSGLMILALDSKASRNLALEFLEGRVKKEYVARVRGEFPECVSR